MDPAPAYVSTGLLPSTERVRALVREAFERYCGITDGKLSQVYPALTETPRGSFGISIASTAGEVVDAGDAELEFTIMSVSKPFVFALVCAERGPEIVRDLVGVNATGLPFNSVDALERTDDGRTNPMVNPGAIATTSLAPGATSEERWRFLLDGLSRFAGRPLSIQEDVFRSASESNHVNRAIANLLEARSRIEGDPLEALDLYTRQSSLSVTSHDLAVMGATLADGGVNPVTGERVVDEAACRHTLAVMTTAGLYETSGDWLYDVGLPGKSGVGGGIVTVAPGKGGLATYSPLIDEAGNSVRGQLATSFLSRALGLDLFASEVASGST